MDTYIVCNFTEMFAHQPILKNFFSLTYFIGRLQCIICITYNISVDRLFSMLSVSFPVKQ